MYINSFFINPRKIFFHYIVVSYLIVDSFNGFLLTNIGSGGVSGLLKIFLIVLSISVVFKNKNSLIIYMLTLIVFIFPIFIRSIFISTDFMISEMSYIFKYLGYVSFLFLFKEFYLNYGFEKFIHRLMLVSYIVIIVNVLAGYLGIGGFTYPASQTGFKGFFFAGNELSAVFVVCSTFLLATAFKENKKIQYLCIFLFSLFISLSIGTKSTIIVTLLSGVVYPFFYYLLSRQFKKIFYSCLLEIMLISFVWAIIVFMGLEVDNLQTIGTLARIVHKFENVDFVTLIFSGRYKWFMESIDYIRGEQLEFLMLFSGIGFENVIKATSGKTLIESDLFDVANISGITALLCVFIYTYFVLYKAIKTRFLQNYTTEIIYINIVVFTIAVFFGHIWTSGMLAIILAALNAIPFACKRNEKNNNGEQRDRSNGNYPCIQ